MNKSSAGAQVRIIGGRWRGSRIRMPEREGLRPTPDRVRETLFNWLANDIPQARVLDCFAGSGALGMEAASRGARQVTLVEVDRHVAHRLQQNCARLGADNINIKITDVLSFLDGTNEVFDIAFIDPPYARPQLREQAIDRLIGKRCLADGAKLYVEWPRDQAMELVTPGLSWLKRKSAGQVVYAIAQWRKPV